MSREDDEKEIEATKAPLMEHLIELRSRLIKALVAFFITFIVLASAQLMLRALEKRAGGG